tara:strand:+ start:36 stop:605 length:570 start_codon:yes stop_codon:yes gene_type:complete
MSKTTIATGGIADDAVTIAKVTGLGKIGQVVTTTFTGTESSTSKFSGETPADSSVYASLTPTATSSKIMVMCTVNAGSSDGSNGMHMGRFAQIISGGATTTVFVGAAASNRILTSSGRMDGAIDANTLVTYSFNFLLSPSTTSAVTVKYQFGVRGTGSGTAYINRTHTDSDSNEFQRTASAITLMEVLA